MAGMGAARSATSSSARFPACRWSAAALRPAPAMALSSRSASSTSRWRRCPPAPPRSAQLPRHRSAANLADAIRSWVLPWWFCPATADAGRGDRARPACRSRPRPRSPLTIVSGPCDEVTRQRSWSPGHGVGRPVIRACTPHSVAGSRSRPSRSASSSSPVVSAINSRQVPQTSSVAGLEEFRLATRGRRRSAPPVLPTSLLGWDREVAEVEGLPAHARLMTLTGPGGVGKTRLALAAAVRAGAGGGRTGPRSASATAGRPGQLRTRAGSARSRGGRRSRRQEPRHQPGGAQAER